MNDIVRAAGLHTYYGVSHIIRGVDIHISGGEAVGLLGRNGMGKTTLIRSILGHVRPAKGRVEIQGEDCTSHLPEQIARRGIAYVPEGRGIFPNLTVEENLIMAARPGRAGRSGWTLERVLNLFPRLKERLRNGGQQLSGGEQQMLAIGRALLTNPNLLILDEATEGLAPLVVQEIWKTISSIRSSGVATLVVDRDYRRVLKHTDRCILLEKGTVTVGLSSSELLERRELIETALGV